MPRTTNRDLARQFLAKFPTHPQKSVAAALRKAHPKRFADLKSAYRTVQGVLPTPHMLRNEPGRPSVDYVAHPKHVLTVPPPLPESHATPWEPVPLEASRILILSDVHIPYHDTPALNAALEHGDSFNPDCVLLNGDIADFYKISRYQQDPERRSFMQELVAVRQFLAHVRARYPQARIVYKLGNHEERWWAYLWRRAPELMGVDFADFRSLVESEKNGVEIVDRQLRIGIGALTVVHGHELPKGLTNPVNPARGAFLRTLDITLMGHQHRTSEHTENSMNGRIVTCWSTGCLCELRPEYMRINRHNHGFATVTRDGADFTVRNYRIHHGRIL